MQHHTLPALVGYDTALLAQIPEASQRHIERVAEAWLLSCALLASPVAYAAWLIEHSLWLSLAVGLATFLLVVNMLRLVAAGGGAATQLSEASVKQYRPALGASLVIGLLALLFAQPAQLPLWRAQLDAPVQVQRELLIAQHAQALQSLGLAEDGDYRRQLEHCDFLVLRLKHMWQAPTRALQLSVLYVLAVLLPTLWARFVALSALREYQLLRWKRDRRQIMRETQATRRVVSAQLAHWPSYVPSADKFADPPFNTLVESPLLKAPRPRRTKAETKRSWLQRWEKP